MNSALGPWYFWHQALGPVVRGTEAGVDPETHVLLLEDKMLYDRTIDVIKNERVNAEWALKKVVCALKQQEFDQCLLRRQCVYALVFKAAKAIPASPNSRIAAPPHTFVIQPPITETTHFPEGSAFEFQERATLSY